MIDALPTEEREQTKSFLAQSLIAVITQVLVKSAGSTRPPRDLRNDGGHQGDRQAHHDRSVAPDPEPAADGQGYGMQLLDQALLAAIKAKEGRSRTRPTRMRSTSVSSSVRHRHELPRRHRPSRPAMRT